MAPRWSPRVCAPSLVAPVALLAVARLGWAGQALIIDHTCTKIQAIPDAWLEQAKQLTFHYAHTSHGGQICSGLENLETTDAKYGFARRVSDTEGLPPVEDPPVLRMYDGNPPETYIGSDDYWDGESGKNRTRAVADTGHYDYSMWSWCGQQSSNSEATTQRYLDTMAQFEAEYPAMRFILMTGHTDGTGETGNLHARNNQVRGFAIARHMVLFDFADIESYNPGWDYFLDRACDDYCNYDGGNWANEWCALYPGDPLCDACSCAHSRPLNCNLKARAFWWMAARLAGWPGPPPPDLDRDGDVDLDDYDMFDACSSGPSIPHSGASACDQADFDRDGDVDQSDFGVFQKCLSGDETLADVNCAE